MTDITAIAFAAIFWSHPGVAPCGPVGSDANPCWAAPRVPDEVYAARFSGDWTPGEICDGDVIENSGARNGVAFVTGPQVADFDLAYLDASRLAYTVRDGRVCIPARDYGGGWLEPLACGNAVRVIRRAESPVAASVVSEYMRGGLPSVGPRTGGGASAHVAPPPFFVGGHNGHNGHTSPIPAVPIPAVPLPQTLALFLGALAILGAMKIGRDHG